MALHASRRVPRFLGFAVNWYIGEIPFHPQIFVSIDGTHWECKINGLQCYKSEFQRVGKEWIGHLDNQALNFGRIIGVKRAEAFVVYKWLMEV